MAKKQTIILTHGTSIPAASGITKGEVLVQHASTAKDSALHTVDDNGNLVSFPSKAYVDDVQSQITGTNGINDKISAINTALAKKLEISDYNADKLVIEGNISALDSLLEGYEGEGAVKDAVDSKVSQSDYNEKIASIESGITSANGLISTAQNDIKALQNADAKIREDFVAADAALETAYKAADTALENKLNAAIDKKANSSDLTALGTRVGTAETNIANLQAADTTIRGEFADADDVVRGEFAAADTALKSELNTEIGKKADKTTVNGIDERLKAVEGDDAGKSMRTVAAAEVKKLEDALYGTGATAAIDTLKDVIDWISEDKVGAADMVADIEELQKVTSGYTGANAIKNAIKAVDDKVAALDNTYATDAQLSGAVSSLETKISEAKTAATTKVVKGTDTNGQLTISGTTGTTGNTYTIGLTNVAKADDLSALNGRVQTIEGEGAGSVKKALADAKTYADGIVATEKTARENADTAINAKLGSGVTSASTATAQFNKITGDIQGINDTISAIKGTGDGSISKALADAKTYADGKVSTEATTRANADTELSNRLGTGVTTGNTATAQFASLDSKITGVGDRVSTIEGAYVKKVKVYNASGTAVELAPTSNVIDLTSMTIDGGTY